MSKATMLLTVILLAMLGTSLHAQTYPRYGYFLYKGPTSIDVYVPKLTDPTYTKAEFFVDGKKFGTATLNGPELGLITATGLSYGIGIATLQVRFTRADASIRTGTVVNAPPFATDGWGMGKFEYYGVLCREDKLGSIQADLSDTLWIAAEGEIPAVNGGPLPNGLPGSSVPGGHMVFENNCDIGYDLSIGSVVSAIYVLDSENSSLLPGRISATGGRLDDVIVYCDGQFSPIADFTIRASDILIDSHYPCELDRVTWDWTKNNANFAVVSSTAANIVARNCTIKNDGQLLGFETMRDCRIESYAIVRGKDAQDNIFFNNGNLTLSPAGVPTICINNEFQVESSLSLSNKSDVRFNNFDHNCVVSINPQSGGFDPADIKDVHVNYNHFKRLGDQGAIISNSQADTIDATLNYWGRCDGPTVGEMVGRKVRYFPCLRVPWPETSYWMDISRNKDQILANDEDELIFSFHFYNLTTGADSAGVEIDYLVRIVGDTLAIGTLTTDVDGKAELRIKIPFKYNNALAVETYFNAIQCNDQSFITSVDKQEGSDIQLYTPKVIQVESASQDLVARKGFVVRATVAATEPVNDPFRVVVRVDGEEFDTFGELVKENLTVQYQFKETKSELVLPDRKSHMLVWFINKTDLDPGQYTIDVIIDPLEPGKPQGRIRESNEANNTASIPVTVVSTSWGNDGSQKASIFVQPIGEHIADPVSRSQSWVDSAMAFMEKAWPMKKSTLSATVADDLADYTWLEPDSLVADTWERYLVKAYKIMRVSNPGYDRYVFSVNEDWFRTRFHHRLFNHKESQTLAYSGIYDLAVASVRHYKQLVHTLGHTWHLRRMDFAPDDPNQQEQYAIAFLGKNVDEGYDVEGERAVRTGLINEVGRFMEAYCFMGGSQTTVGANPYYVWISGSEYLKLTNTFAGGSGGSGNSTPVKSVLIEGRVDSVSNAFEFGPWARLDNAVPSMMVEDTYAKYIFKAVDGSGTVLSTHNYTPTFRALGLDETDPSKAPKMLHEYFAFVMPAPANATKVVLETAGGQFITERNLSANGPVLSILPLHGSTVLKGDVPASWSATDPDGDTEFWYTVYFSDDGGNTWDMIQFESQATSTVLKDLPVKAGYHLRVIASDGVNSTELSSLFDVSLTSVDRPISPDIFALYQNYPNPFNPTTSLTYSMPNAGFATIDVYDALGRTVRTLVSEYMGSGIHNISFDATGLPSGNYTAILRSNGLVSSIRMTLNK
jgi:hypothetical protein